MQCKDVDTAVQNRLDKGYEFTMATGKLMERLLVMSIIREGMPLESLDDIYFKWDWERQPDGPPCINAPIPDHTRAAFYKSVLTQAEKRLSSIR